MVNAQCLTTMVTSSCRSSGQDMGLGGLGMAQGYHGWPSTQPGTCTQPCPIVHTAVPPLFTQSCPGRTMSTVVCIYVAVQVARLCSRRVTRGYCQFEVGWLQLLRFWLGVGISSVAPVLNSPRDKKSLPCAATWGGGGGGGGGGGIQI